MEGFFESAPLAEARDYERRMESYIDPESRPCFHLTPRAGWMNDPNGFSYYQGAYHLFYQYNPYATAWAAMHWGHAVSKDLLHWEYLPAALAPDEPYDDKSGCFSGSAIELPDGHQLLIYTGVGAGRRKPDGRMGDRQTQCLAVGDGADYVKYEENPVIGSENLATGASIEHFRDPKIWRCEDGTYRCVAVRQTPRAAERFCCLPATTRSRGASWACLRKTTIVTAPCGSARTSLSLTARASFS